MPEPVTFGATVRRILRLACPACGRGPLFRRFFVRAEHCSSCGWRFERGEGHWVGGSEVHMFVSYGLSVLVCIPIVIVAGTSAGALLTVAALHVGISLTAFRYSRAVFLGLDYWIDPAAPPRDDDGDGPPVPVRPRTPTLDVPPPERRRVRARRPEREPVAHA